MATQKYTQNFFSSNASKWVQQAYADQLRYPVGSRRVAIALAAVKAFARKKGRFLDIGCGGGELAIDAVKTGFDVTGMDMASGMISECNKKKKSLSSSLQKKIVFKAGSAEKTTLESDSYDAISALGLVEYLKGDSLFFKESKRLLRKNGVLVVSCRNRLFNMNSLNNYTMKEIRSKTAARLLSEIMDLTAKKTNPDMLKQFVRNLEILLPDLKKSLTSKVKIKKSKEFMQPRRQHTPQEYGAIGEKYGFKIQEIVAVHPHPLPPVIKFNHPEFYNCLSRAFDVFENDPLGLIWSSTFMCVMKKK